MELIDKAAVVAEMERRIKERDIQMKSGCWVSSTYIYEDLLDFLDTIEAKEVDIEKEIDSYFERFQNVQCDEDCCNKDGFCCVLDNDLKIVDIERCRKIASHFYELGLNANNNSVIEKACEWLKNNVVYTNPRTGETKCVVNLNAFIDAMKGE